MPPQRNAAKRNVRRNGNFRRAALEFRHPEFHMAKAPGGDHAANPEL